MSFYISKQALLINIIAAIDSRQSKKNSPRLFLLELFQKMSALFILIGVSIVVAVSFLAAFLWSVKNGQYDDDYTPSVRMLFDDKIPAETINTSEIKIQNK